MRLVRQMLYNASLVSLFQELYKKYPHPIVIYDSSADDGCFNSSPTTFNSQGMPKGLEYNCVDDFMAESIYQTVSALNSQWISRSLQYDHSRNDQRIIEINSLHVFCVGNVLDSMHLIRDHILGNSNNYNIQNVILFKDLDPPLSVNIFEENERLHRNTILCQRHLKNITCWHWTQQIDRKNSTLTDLLYERVNLNLSVIQINANLSPPNGFVPCFSGRFIYSGPNAMVAAEILSKFNATPRYCSEFVVRVMKTGNCNRIIDKINEDDALKMLRQLKYGRKVTVNNFHFLFDSRMIKYLFFGLGQCETPPDLNMDIGAMDEKNNMTALVPTELSCISILVPRAPAASSFLRRTFYNSVESIAFYCTVLLFTIARILISKFPFTQWFDIFYSTFVVYLNQTTLKPKTEAERILYGFLLVLSVTTTVMLSGLIFTNMVNNPSSKSIQTVNDLAASEFKILALDNAGNWMNHLRDDIRERIIVVRYTAIVNQILKRNNTVALAVNENVLGLVKTTWDSTSLDTSLRDDYYIMREKLHCGHFSYRILDDLALENDINQILHRMVEHGFISAYKKWSIHLMKLLNLFLTLTKDERLAVNFASSHGIYYAWFGGILLSAVVFLCELCYKRVFGE